MHQKIKIKRQLKKLKQYELANLLEVSPNYVSLIEKGVKTPSIALLKKISIILDIRLSELLDSNEEDSTLMRDLQLLAKKYDLDDLFKNIEVLKKEQFGKKKLEIRSQMNTIV